MADFDRPSLLTPITSNLDDLRENINASARMLRGVNAVFSNIPTDAVIFEDGRFQRWDGLQFNTQLLGISGGGTGAATAQGARQALGLNNASNITTGTLDSRRLNIQELAALIKPFL